MSENRQAFERFISSSPFEKNIERFPDDGTKYPWPGAYCDITVELAWECWREATSVQIARFESQLAAAEARIPRWIPVGESMPAIAEPYVEYGEWVLGKERYYKVPIICCRTWIDKEQNYWEWTAENGGVIDVTHWMPLPEPPVSDSGMGE